MAEWLHGAGESVMVLSLCGVERAAGVLHARETSCRRGKNAGISPLRRKKRGPFDSAQGRDDSIGVGWMKDEACGSEVWGFGSVVIGRVETPALPVLAMAE